MEKFINAHGRNLIGWSEIREGGLAQNAAVMDWIGGAIEAASAGHDVVMSPNAVLLPGPLSIRATTPAEPRAIGGFLPLRARSMRMSRSRPNWRRSSSGTSWARKAICGPSVFPTSSTRNT